MLLAVPLAAADGGGEPRVWLAALLVLAVALIVLGLRVRAPSAPRLVWIALAALGSYVLWSYASISWAHVPATALAGADRTALYGLAFALPALLPWSRRAAERLLVVYVAGIGALAVVTTGRLGLGDAPALLVEGRLSSPLSYANADAALWTMAATVAICLAARPAASHVARACGCGVAALGVGLALLSQSRGWLVALPVVVTLLAVIAGRGSIRLLAFAAITVLTVGVASGPLLDVYASAEPTARGASGHALDAALRHAGGQAALALGAAVVLATLLGAATSLLERRGYLRRRTWMALAILAIAATLAGAALPGSDLIAPIDAARAQLSGESRERPASSSRFDRLESERFDGWRVAIDAWRDHPLTGLGQDNFADTYLQERRRADVSPIWVHSLPLRVIAHTGIVGGILLAGFVLAVWLGIGRLARRDGMLAAALAAPLLYWAVAGSVDWLWEVPALSVAAFSLAGISMRAGVTEVEPLRHPHAYRVAAPLVAALLLLAAAPASVAAQAVHDALGTAQRDPQRALRRLSVAASLDVLDSRPLRLSGVVRMRLGQFEAADTDLARAVGRDPRDWLAWLEWGFLASLQGERGPARDRVARALALSPRDGIVEVAATEVRSPSGINVGTLNAKLARRPHGLRSPSTTELGAVLGLQIGQEAAR